jgi:hypothetical protein
VSEQTQLPEQEQRTAFAFSTMETFAKIGGPVGMCEVDLGPFKQTADPEHTHVSEHEQELEQTHKAETDPDSVERFDLLKLLLHENHICLVIKC